MDYFQQTLRTDYEDLLGRFHTTASVRFEEFSAIWREMKFSMIFNGILEPSKKKAFTRLALSVASPYLLPPYSFQIRVGGLYLLYSLYVTQPDTPKEQIRIALKDWDDLMHFHQEAASAQHCDVVFIFKKLRCEKAFFFTAMPDMLTFQMKKRRADRRQPPSEVFVDRPSRPQQLINTSMLEELVNIHEHYEGLKKAVIPQQRQSDVSLAKHNLVPKLRSAILTFSSWQRNQADFEPGSDRDAEGTSNQEESSRRAQLLASIKSKSYAQTVEVSKSRRHRQSEVMSSDQDTEPTQHVTHHKRPLSLKERTTLRLMTHESRKSELQRSTMLWRLTPLEGENVEGKKKRFNWKESASSEH